jgi:hypothetical protein
MTSRFSSRFAALLVAVVGASSVFASDTTTYTYDSLGRLRSVTVSGTQTSIQTYSYDPAGNRTGNVSGTVPSAPPSISVPSSSITGSYTISWGASTGTINFYELYQATNASFSGASKVYSGATASAALTGRPNGTYYYRARACLMTTACSGYATGGNPIVVTLPPSSPASITVPSGSITGGYTISWGTSSGNVTAYELQEATNSSFSGATPAYTGTGTGLAISGKGNGSYYYRVRACNTSVACSSYVPGTNATLVTLPPSVPGATSVASPYNNTGAYTISWGASTGLVTAYELLENVVFGSETLIYSGTGTSTSVSGKADNVYSYRVRACNTAAACSGYTATQGNGASVYVDKIAPTPPASTFMSTNGGYILSWSGGSTDTAGAGSGSGVGSWRVYRNGSNIATVAQPQQSFTDSPPTNVQLSYTVRSVDRAGNESGNSPAASLYIDTVPPTTPGNFRATSVTTGSVTLAWDASTDAFGISWYRIARSDTQTQMGNGNNSTSYVDNTVASGTTYTYQVFAVDGHGVESTPASVQVTTPLGAPGTPTMNPPLFTAKNTSGSWTVSWSSVTGATSYKLSENGALTTLTTTSKSYSGKQNGTYSYQVQACGSNGLCGGFSQTKTVIVCRSGTSCE